MKNLFAVCICLFVFTGCVMNTENLTFKDDKKFRVTFNCEVPFDDTRKVAEFEERNSTKDSYYVDFGNIYESKFEVTKTYVKDSEFTLEDYVKLLEEDGVTVLYQEKIDNILYIQYQKWGKLLNQIISTTKHNINIVTAEPKMFEKIKGYCSKK